MITIFYFSIPNKTLHSVHLNILLHVLKNQTHLISNRVLSNKHYVQIKKMWKKNTTDSAAPKDILLNLLVEIIYWKTLTHELMFSSWILCLILTYLLPTDILLYMKTFVFLCKSFKSFWIHILKDSVRWQDKHLCPFESRSTILQLVSHKSKASLLLGRQA